MLKKGKKKYYVILGQVLRDTLQSITYYFAKYHRCVKKSNIYKTYFTSVNLPVCESMM